MGDETFSLDFMDSFISAFDTRWNLTELQDLKAAAAFISFLS